MLWRMLGADHPMEAHRVDSRGIQSRGASADAREGVESFLEKRQPVYPVQGQRGPARHLPRLRRARLPLTAPFDRRAAVTPATRCSGIPQVDRRCYRCLEQRTRRPRQFGRGRSGNTMSTMVMQQLTTGDVIEITGADGDVMTVLVLLATDDSLVLDPCNDETPFVVNVEGTRRVSAFRRRVDVRRRLRASTRSPEAVPLPASRGIPLAWAPWFTRRPRCFSGSAACRSSSTWSTRSMTACRPMACCCRCTRSARSHRSPSSPDPVPGPVLGRTADLHGRAWPSSIADATHALPRRTAGA